MSDTSNSTQTEAAITEEVDKVLKEETFVTVSTPFSLRRKFPALQNQITVVWLLLSVTVCLTYWLQKYRISKVLPPSIAAMVLGVLVGIVINSFDSRADSKWYQELKI